MTTFKKILVGALGTYVFITLKVIHQVLSKIRVLLSGFLKEKNTNCYKNISKIIMLVELKCHILNVYLHIYHIFLHYT